MIENIKQYTEEYFKNYQEIIRKYCPSHNGNGFTEQNMTVRFATAVEALCEGSFTWYEAPLQGQNQKYIQHMDAVIFDPKEKNIFLVESKRFSTLKKKIEALGDDINRMHDLDVLSVVSGGLKNQKNPPTVYGVVLADVWLVSNSKKELWESWKNENFSKKYVNWLDLKCTISPHYYQNNGCEVEYKDQNNNIKKDTHVLLALAFKISSK